MALCGWRLWPRLLLIAGLTTGSQVLAADKPSGEGLAEVDLAAPADRLAALRERIADAKAPLKARGIEIGLTYIGETFSNLRGGVRQGSIYQGRLDVQVDADLGILAGWDGLSFHTNAYQLHGTGLSRYYVGNLATVSGIESLPATRLHELWLEQAFFDKALTVRAGQLAADAEFLVSPSATVFVNQTFGWPVLAGVNLPSGGPASPLATPGIRAKWRAAEKTTLMVGLFNGDPVDPRASELGIDPQRRNRDGLDFSLHGSSFVMAELSRGYVAAGPGPERTGTAKIGYFHHFAHFKDPHFDSLGRSLADPASTGIGRRRRGEDGFYAILDQTIYREDETSGRGAAAFVKALGSPSAASLVDLYVDAGLVYKGLIPSRPDDVAGVSIAYSRLAGSVAAYDRDRIAFEGIALPVRRSEAVVEMTYQAVIAPGFTIQPDLQYIKTPGGHTWNPRTRDYKRIRDSVVCGVRVSIQF